MKIFISWSGPRSQQLAVALRTWIHDVIHTVECFSSTDDIRSGQRWNNEINGELSKTDFGILCVTPENVGNPWLNFESGALAKRIENDARVVPVTLGFQPSALDEPLKQFNGVPANRTGITKLMKDIAAVDGVDIDVERAVEKWWADLEQLIADIPALEEPVDAPEPPDVAEMFTDIMASVRGLSRDVQMLDIMPRSRVSASELQMIAALIAESPKLGEDVMKGTPGAIEFLRRKSRQMSDDRRHGIRRDPLLSDDRTAPSDGGRDVEGDAAVAEARAENGD
ncbi:toll/interleukin-1 receptor domain-containing protein [Microbacterium sp. NPDC087868]|uniref:toll/interleukin-1 receptor domain-containing protein n=1 Tax=Microbacterium sp. NPDC087868 TaxID=3364195 RepID=UPI0038516705